MKSKLRLIFLIFILFVLSGSVLEAKESSRIKRFKKEIKSKSPGARLAAIEDLGEPENVEEVKLVFNKGFDDDSLLVRLISVSFLSAGKHDFVSSWLIKHGLGRKQKDVRKKYLTLKTLAKLGDQTSAEPIRNELNHKHWSVRAEGVLALSTLHDKESIPIIEGLLKDKDYRVRIAAVEALSVINLSACKDQLLNQLLEEQNWRVQSAILDALVKVGDESVVSQLRQWGRGVSGVMADRSKTAVNKILTKQEETHNTSFNFYGISSDSDRVIFVIDCSKSMSAEIDEEEYEIDLASGVDENILGLVQTELMKSLQKLKEKNETSRFNLIFVRDTADVWKKSMLKASKSNVKKAKKVIKRQTPTGLTNLYDGLAQAMQFEEEGVGSLDEKRLDEGPDTIYLLTDGVANAGTFRDDKSILSAIQEINRYARMTIHTVTIGPPNRLMKSLSQFSGGKTKSIKRVQQ